MHNEHLRGAAARLTRVAASGRERGCKWLQFARVAEGEGEAGQRAAASNMHLRDHEHDQDGAIHG